jgi:hypothetical protein
MKQIIIIAPHFPPSNLAGVHRSRLFAMHLPKLGWKVKILSVDPIYYRENRDSEIEALVPKELEVIRTKAFPRRFTRLFGIGDIGIRSLWWHYRALKALIKKEKIDLIYLSIPPNYSAILGPMIYRKFSVPYALDYQDPWIQAGVLNHMPRIQLWKKYFTKWMHEPVAFSKAWGSARLAKILEPIALRHVSLITGVAPSYYEGVLERYPWLEKVPCAAMPIGAERADFDYLDRNPRAPYLFDSTDGKVHIVYAGAMLPKAYSTLEAFFQALVLLKKKEVPFISKLRFHFIGTGKVPTDPKSFLIKPYIMKYGLEGMVFEYPARIPYLDVLNHLKSSTVVLILGSSESHYTPSKLFQAVLSQRPILALLHSASTAVKILSEANTGHVVCFNEEKSVDACIEEIAKRIESVVNDEYHREKINWDAFYAYSAEAVTQQLSEAFEKVLR